MKFRLTSMYVDDREKALRFCPEVLGFVRKTDSASGLFRRVSVVPRADPGGAELLEEPSDGEWGSMARVKDTRANLVQITQLKPW